VETDTIIISSTLSIEDYFTATATTDVTSEAIASSTQIVDVTAIAVVTSTAIADITVVTTTATQTSAITSTITVPETATVVTTEEATATATPLCGVNLVQNGDFPEGSFNDWTITATIGQPGGYPNPQINYDCTVDPFCPLIVIEGTGSSTISQTISTYPGQEYTLSYGHNLYASQSGSLVECYVNAEGAAPVVATGPQGGTYNTASGTFTASSTSTLLTCSVSTDSYAWVNFEAIHVECTS
jgi:hypothetical protein